MKTKSLEVKKNVRGSSIAFVNYLRDVGARVRYLVRHQQSQRDVVLVAGRGKFSVEMAFDYERQVFDVKIFSRKGVQSRAVLAHPSELRALFSTWNICAY